MRGFGLRSPRVVCVFRQAVQPQALRGGPGFSAFAGRRQLQDSDRSGHYRPLFRNTGVGWTDGPSGGRLVPSASSASQFSSETPNATGSHSPSKSYCPGLPGPRTGGPSGQRNPGRNRRRPKGRGPAERGSWWREPLRWSSILWRCLRVSVRSERPAPNTRPGLRR